MRTVKTFLFLFLFSLASIAKAQFANSSSSSVVTATGYDGWTDIHVSYNSTEFDVEGSDRVMGIEVGCTKAFSISNKMPLFIETGLNAIWTFGELSKYEDSYYSYSYSSSVSLFSVKVPINLVYKFDLNEKVSIMPFAGVYCTGNISGTLTVEEDGVEYDFDMFDEDEGDCKRFQFGLNLGAKCKFNKITLGVGYGFDLNEIDEDCKVNTLNFSVGYCF